MLGSSVAQCWRILCPVQQVHCLECGLEYLSPENAWCMWRTVSDGSPLEGMAMFSCPEICVGYAGVP
jgi:hypothetical protein